MQRTNCPDTVSGVHLKIPPVSVCKYISNFSDEPSPTSAFKYIAQDHYEKFHLKFIMWSLSVHSSRLTLATGILVSAEFHEQAELELPWNINLPKLITKYRGSADTKPNTSAKLSA